MPVEQGTAVYCSAATWARFTAKVVITPGCHYWIGAIADAGHGRFNAGGRTVRASRVLWTAFHGPLPPNTVVMHQVCDEPSCVRLADLRAGSQAENLASPAGPQLRLAAHRHGRLLPRDPRRPARRPRPGPARRRRPPSAVGRAVLTRLRPTLAAPIAAEHSGPATRLPLHRTAGCPRSMQPRPGRSTTTVMAAVAPSARAAPAARRRRPEHGVVAAPARPPHQRLGPARRPVGGGEVLTSARAVAQLVAAREPVGTAVLVIGSPALHAEARGRPAPDGSRLRRRDQSLGLADRRGSARPRGKGMSALAGVALVDPGVGRPAQPGGPATPIRT